MGWRLQFLDTANRSKLPDAEYVVNPNTGCELGCQYCYPSFTGRFVRGPVDNWGSYVYAKINAVSVFKAELERVRRADRAPSIPLSSVTDAYQGIEKKYRLELVDSAGIDIEDVLL